MMTVSLEVASRNTGDAVDRTQYVLGVVYGPKQESIPLRIDRATIEKLYKEAGESTIIVLEGLDEPLEVLVHDIDFDPVRSQLRHVDFYAIERGKELTTNVPLTYVGTPPAEEKDGVLTKVLYEIEITCRPGNLPHDIEVDVSGLTELDSQIKIKDIVLPEGVTVTNDADDIVAQIVPVQEEKEEVDEEVDMDAVEVEEKGKSDAESAEDETKE